MGHMIGGMELRGEIGLMCVIEHTPLVGVSLMEGRG